MDKFINLQVTNKKSVWINKFRINSVETERIDESQTQVKIDVGIRELNLTLPPASADTLIQFLNDCKDSE